MVSNASFPFGGGETGRLLRNLDWSTSPLGLVSEWSEVLRGAVSMMLPAAAQIVLFWGPEFVALYNDAYAPTIGNKHPLALGRPAREHWAELWDDLEPLLLRAQRGETVVAKDRPFQINRSGYLETVYFDISYSPAFNADKEVEGVVCIVSETTERVHTHRALEESEARWRELADNISQFVWTADASGAIYWFNRRWHEYTGTTLDEVRGWGWKRMHHPDHIDRVIKRISHCFANGEPWEDTFPLRAKDGTYRWFLSRALPIRDDTGKVIRWFGSNTDVTAQIDFERLEKSEAQLRSIFETSYQFMGLTTPDGILIDANPTALAAIEARIEDVMGHPVWETPWFTGTPGLSDNVRAAVPRVAAGETVRAEMAVDLPIGRRAFDFAMRPVRSANREIMNIFIEAIDITERRATEEQLRQAQKMEAVGQLTGGIAHDFNNLLTGIIAAFSLIRRRIDAGRISEVGRLIDAGTASAQRAAGLTQRLLAFSRGQTLDLKAVDVRELVGLMQELVQRTLGERIALEIRCGDALWPAHGDANQIESALLNFAINARDAMHDGGTLTIEAENLHSPGGGPAELEPGDYVVLRVRDTGEGMPPEVLEKALDPFFTTKPVGQGTGLGLSMAYGYAKQSHGGLDIESQPGKGTTISLFMPRERGGAPPGPTAAPAST